MKIGDMFKQGDGPCLILEPWEPTKQQKYASVIITCLRLGVKIPVELLEEYNGTVKDKE